ncbi:hypothetical protein EJ04DRAFT_432757, partial [Polyplosphaeria fusca]
VWDARSGKCLSTLEVGRSLHLISFDPNNNNLLRTDIGVIDISAQSISTLIAISAGPQIPQYQGVALSKDKVWITYKSNNLLWLPSEYRPSCSATIGDIIAIGVGNGRIWLCEVRSSTF